MNIRLSVKSPSETVDVKIAEQIEQFDHSNLESSSMLSIELKTPILKNKGLIF